MQKIVLCVLGALGLLGAILSVGAVVGYLAKLAFERY